MFLLFLILNLRFRINWIISLDPILPRPVGVVFTCCPFWEACMFHLFRARSRAYYRAAYTVIRLGSMANHSTQSYLPYFTQGTVVQGFGRGSKELGIPTGELEIARHCIYNIVRVSSSQLSRGSRGGSARGLWVWRILWVGQRRWRASVWDGDECWLEPSVHEREEEYGECVVATVCHPPLIMPGDVFVLGHWISLGWLIYTVESQQEGTRKFSR